MQAGFWKGSLVMQSKSFLPSKNMIGLYIQYNILSLSIFSDVPGYSSYITLTGVCNAICTKVYNASCMILDPWTGIPQGFPISDLNSWGCIYIYIRVYIKKNIGDCHSSWALLSHILKETVDASARASCFLLCFRELPQNMACGFWFRDSNGSFRELPLNYSELHELNDILWYYVCTIYIYI